MRLRRRVLGRSNNERRPPEREFAFAKFDLVTGESQLTGREECSTVVPVADPSRESPDLSPLFNWNTKQVFVYLVADYSTKSHVSLRPLLLVL